METVTETKAAPAPAAATPATATPVAPAPEMISSGQIVAKMLKQEGIKHIFTISGGHIVDIYNGCIDEGIEIVDVRHEQVAAHAADAYARITGLGCAVVTAGPGTTDAVTGMANAFRAESPMLLIGGNSALKQYRMGGLQELRHTEMMTPISQIRLARHDHRTRRGNDGHRLPRDVQRRARPRLPRNSRTTSWTARSTPSKVRYPKNYRVRGADGGPPDFIGDPKIVQQVADLLANAERPVALFGTQARTCRAHDAIDRFARHFNMPIYVNGSARGTLPRDHPYAFMPSRKAAFDNADVILLAGTPLDFRMGYGQRLNPEGKDRHHGHGLQERRQQSRLRFRPRR